MPFIDYLLFDGIIIVFILVAFAVFVVVVLILVFFTVFVTVVLFVLILRFGLLKLCLFFRRCGSFFGSNNETGYQKDNGYHDPDSIL